ncbi:hypothetical protein BD309DRAFT_990663 [Dichomitus squalens]|uniref:Uncharacterized protein n=1 Tax=Dichomitus squalens TaxID=114155 RepID=A0A4Q9NWC1_9APHY|nr:hypothetical protein BD311DRAFT_780206 [Dichomitus squalens]TBU43906.1 hypothetical protein BD309DRAFT_990663 [Dichomitus squalens]TBU60441.1 hypothetical protein BD310DRAFT_815312 [Dichomitus squalens]
MEVHTGKLQMQRSWFNSFVDSELENDGHAKGWTLPTVAELWTRTKVQVLKEEEDVEEFRRLDEDVEEPDDKTPSTPGTASKTLAPLLWNALLSPRLRKGQTSQHGIDDPPPDDPYGSAGERSLELDDGDGSREIEADGAATPTAHVHRSLSLPNLSQENTELMSSPSAAYLQRKRLGAGIRREDVQLAAPSSGSTSLAPIVPASTSDVGAPDSSSVRARDNSARLGGMRRRWPPPVGPLYPKELPNGKRLPHDWATMTTSDQILMLCLSTPQDSQGNRMFKEAFQNIGLPSTQLREMLGYVQDLKSANQEKSRQTSTTPGILLPRRSVARPSAAEQLAGVLRDKNLQQAKDRHLNIGSRESRTVGHKEDVSEKGKERARS